MNVATQIRTNDELELTMKTSEKNWSTSVTLCRESFLRTLLFVSAFLSLVIGLAGADSTKTTLVPTVVSTSGYINPTPLTSHMTATFNTAGSTTMVAYVSSHPFWNGHPVSIVGLRDNVGNSWKLLEGPTLWQGSTVPLLSAIYYVNAPITSEAYSVTVNLSNPAPLVVHVIAVSGSDITATPQHSAINSLDAGGKSVDVTTEPIKVPDHTLLLAWAKNESIAKASALDGYTLDQQSTGFLWGEYKPVLVAGSYASHFQYDAAIGHQTAILAIRPSAIPVASSQTFATRRKMPVNISLNALSPSGHALTYTLVSGPVHGSLSGTFPNLTYTPEANYVGNDSLAFEANDGTGKSNKASVRIAVQPRSTIQLAQENQMKIGFSSILALVVLAARLRLKGYAAPRAFQVQAD